MYPFSRSRESQGRHVSMTNDDKFYRDPRLIVTEGLKSITGFPTISTKVNTYLSE